MASIQRQKALFIGGTGTISAAIVRRLAKDPAWEVWLLNRGTRQSAVPDGVRTICCDISDEEDARKLPHPACEAGPSLQPRCPREAPSD